MGVSVRGNTHEHLHSPCPRCGFARRFKQWPVTCACSREHRPDLPPPPESEPCRLGELPDGKLTCLTHARSVGGADG